MVPGCCGQDVDCIFVETRADLTIAICTWFLMIPCSDICKVNTKPFQQNKANLQFCWFKIFASTSAIFNCNPSILQHLPTSSHSFALVSSFPTADSSFNDSDNIFPFTLQSLLLNFFFFFSPSFPFPVVSGDRVMIVCLLLLLSSSMLVVGKTSNVRERVMTHCQHKQESEEALLMWLKEREE